MEHNLLTLDFWRDTVCYEGKTVPTGTLGCAALNLSDKTIQKLTGPCDRLKEFMAGLNTGMPDTSMLPAAKEAAEQAMQLLHSCEPFSGIDLGFYLDSLPKPFSEEGVQSFQAYTMGLLTGTLDENATEEYRHGILLGRLTPVLAQLADSLQAYKEAMTEFAQLVDADDADRSPDGFAELFGKAFPPEVSFVGTDWMSMMNTTVQYVSVEKEDSSAPLLVKRMHYVSFVGLLRSDLFEGLCVGHAPKRCRICGKWFLTVNARHTKYCGGLAPGDKRGRTCRQLGNLKGRESRELAADHPLKQIYERRMNSIRQAVRRGSLDAELAEAMKRIAKDHMYKAVSNPEYARTSYAAKMEQAALMDEARQKENGLPRASDVAINECRDKPCLSADERGSSLRS